jgi:hypothetical protein
MRWPVLVLVPLLACGDTTSTPADITGPFTGPTTRFIVDRFDLATDGAGARALGDDLDGNGTVDNQLGEAIASLAANQDVTSHSSDMIASGVIASSLELQAPDLMHADKAGATYFGSDNAPADAMGGTIAQSAFTSNRSRTTHVPGKAILHLPVFADADPSVFELDAMEADLVPDGSGGYNAVVRGAVAPGPLLAAVGTGALQMVSNDPQAHLVLARIYDANHDGIVTSDEITNNALVKSLLAPDVTVLGQQMTALAISVHVVPCASGACTTSAPADRCHDRVLDGDETDIDCGGSCGACRGGAACVKGGDCQSGACNSNACAAPSCSDGIRNGFESDTDCGWNCGACAEGKQCVLDADCATGLSCRPGPQASQYTCQ